MVGADAFYYKNIEEAINNLIENRRPIILYGVNFIFDTLTIMATVIALKLILIAPFYSRPFIIFIDLTIASIFAFVCYVLSVGAEFPETAVLDFRDLTFRPLYLRSEFQFWLGYLKEFTPFNLHFVPEAQFSPITPNLDPLFSWRSVYIGDVGSFLFAITTLIPTIFVVGSIFVIGVCMITLNLIRVLSMQLFQLDIETDKSVFFYTATSISILGSSVKLLYEVAKFV